MKNNIIRGERSKHIWIWVVEKMYIIKNKAFHIEVETENDMVTKATVIEVLDEKWEDVAYIVPSFAGKDMDYLRSWFKLLKNYKEEEVPPKSTGSTSAEE